MHPALALQRAGRSSWLDALFQCGGFWLQIALRTGAFPTRVDVCIVSNHPARVQTLVDGWRMPHLRVCGTTNVLNPEEQYALLWEHRQVLEQAYQTGEPSTSRR